MVIYASYPENTGESRALSSGAIGRWVDAEVWSSGKMLSHSHQHTALRAPSRPSAPALLAARPPTVPRICYRPQRPAPRIRDDGQQPIHLQRLSRQPCPASSLFMRKEIRELPAKVCSNSAVSMLPDALCVRIFSNFASAPEPFTCGLTCSISGVSVEPHLWNCP